VEIYGGGETISALLLTSAIVGDECSASHPVALFVRKKPPQHLLNKRLDSVAYAGNRTPAV
jgi:hypothetical protein